MPQLVIFPSSPLCCLSPPVWWSCGCLLESEVKYVPVSWEEELEQFPMHWISEDAWSLIPFPGTSSTCEGPSLLACAFSIFWVCCRREHGPPALCGWWRVWHPFPDLFLLVPSWSSLDFPSWRVFVACSWCLMLEIPESFYRGNWYWPNYTDEFCTGIFNGT